MKLSLSIAFLAATTVQGFAPATFGVRPTTELAMSRPDASQAIKEALAASQKYGPTSQEARMAWETVEEIDASDNSVATAPSLNEECLTEGDVSAACMEYGEKLDQLSQLVKQNKPHIEQMRGLATELQKIKLNVAKSAPAEDSPELRAALKEAQAATEKYGATSSEAKNAWDNVEEIASSGLNNSLGGMLGDECLVETMEACEALDELNRALNLAKAGDDRYSG